MRRSERTPARSAARQRVWAQTLAHEPAAQHFAESIRFFEAGNAQIGLRRTRAAQDLAR